MVKSKKISERLTDISIYAILALVTLICLLPLVHTVAVSLSDKSAADAGMVLFWPIRATLTSYARIVSDNKFIISFFNSVKRVLLGVIVNMTLTILPAYPLSKKANAFPQRNVYMWFMVFTMLFYGGLIPNFLVVKNLGLLDSIWDLVLPGAVPVFSVIILMDFFRNLPEEIEEAARIDGAGPWMSLILICLPLSLPSLATIALFSIVGHWNAFFDGIIYINSNTKIPLQTYIQQLVTTTSMLDRSTLSPEDAKALNEISNKTFNAAKVFVTMIPVLCVYPFLQKFFVKGLIIGSVKG